MKKLLIIASSLLLASCMVSEHKTRSAVEAHGMDFVEAKGPSLKCSEGDKFSRNFVATNHEGKTVYGTACAGFIKGVTIRIDRVID